MYEVVILGGGPGGYVCAIRCAQLGLKTALVEKDSLGGTCLNRGCIPTKALLKNAEILYELQESSKRGILVDQVRVDLETVRKMKQDIVSQLVSGVEIVVRSNGIDIYQGCGEVVADNKIAITSRNGDSKVISYEKLVLATGSKNMIPPVPGLDCEGVMTSTKALELESIPQKLVVMGGGVIGCELAMAYHSMGSDVRIVEMQERILPNMDKDLSAGIAMHMKNLGIQVLTNTRVCKVEQADEGLMIHLSDETVLEAERLLVSVGRRAVLDGMNSLGLKIENGYVAVNESMETSAQDVYAIGDLTGKLQLAHVASAQGMIVAENLAGGNCQMRYECIPMCVYTLPEIGTVGMDEETAKALHANVIVGKFPNTANGRALSSGDSRGFVKVVADGESKKVLGVQMMGLFAAERIAEAAAFIGMEATLNDIMDVVHAHPTVSEALHEACHLAVGEPIHMPKF